MARRSPTNLRLSGATRPLEIRTQMSMRWRIFWAVTAIAVLVGSGFATYMLGKRTGIDAAQDAVGEQAQLKERVAELQAELHRLRTATVTSDSRIQIEKSAQGQLANQLKVVEAENAKLKEELTFFETLVPGGKEDRLTIHSLRVEPNGTAGEYKYRMLLFAGSGRRSPDFTGTLQLVLNVQNSDRSDLVITLPDVRTAPDSSYKLRFRRMQRVEGVFRVDPTAKVREVQVRVLETGATQPNATQTFTLSKGAAD
jgi:hypothetical protein